MMDFRDKYYWRQVFLMLGIWAQGMSMGVILAYPTVLTSSAANYNATGIDISPEDASWLAASLGFSGIIGFLILSALFQISGRRIAHTTLCFFNLISWVIFYFADSITWLFIGRFFHGLCFGSIYLNSVIISEYTSPVSRGYFITMMKVIMAMGSTMCHCLSLWSWREPAAAASGIAFLSIVFTMCWPESPAFYASKGRFKECKKTFIWLHGSSVEKKKELAELITAQMEWIKMKRAKTGENRCIVFFKTFLERGFQKALIMALLITLVLDTCGRYYVVAFIIQIMESLVGTGHAVYYTIAIDCIITFALTISCFLVRYVNRRTILFTFGFSNVLLMFSITFASFLQYKYEVLANIVWLSPFLLLLQNFVVNVSVIPICYALLGEVFPLEYRGIGSLISGLMFCFFYGVNIKSTPIMLKDLGLGGTYATYAFCLAVFLIMLYFIVPETKNKTLQEIEDEMKGIKRNVDIDDALMNLKADIAEP